VWTTCPRLLPDSLVAGVWTCGDHGVTCPKPYHYTAEPLLNHTVKIHCICKYSVVVRRPMHRWLCQECELNLLDEHSQSQNHRLGTPCPLTLDLVMPCRLSNAISKPTCSDTPSRRHHGAIQMLYYYYYYYYCTTSVSTGWAEFNISLSIHNRSCWSLCMQLTTLVQTTRQKHTKNTNQYMCKLKQFY